MVQSRPVRLEREDHHLSCGSTVSHAQQIMSIPIVTIHHVNLETAWLLDNVDEDVFDHPVDSSFLNEHLSNPSNALFVAVIDDQVVGMATGIAYVHPDKPRSLFVNEVGVSQRHHRQGIGKRLVKAILEWGKNQGCAEAWVATEVGNVAARALYRSTGGVTDDELAIVYTYSLEERSPKETAP